jgi:hypothetical protein
MCLDILCSVFHDVDVGHLDLSPADIHDQVAKPADEFALVSFEEAGAISDNLSFDGELNHPVVHLSRRSIDNNLLACETPGFHLDSVLFCEEFIQFSRCLQVMLDSFTAIFETLVIEPEATLLKPSLNPAINIRVIEGSFEADNDCGLLGTWSPGKALRLFPASYLCETHIYSSPQSYLKTFLNISFRKIEASHRSLIPSRLRGATVSILNC